MTLRLQGASALAIVAAMAVAMLDIVIAYEIGPLAAALLPVAVLALAAIWQEPMFGVCAGVLAIPLEAFDIRAGGTAGFSGAELLLIATAGVLAFDWLFVGRARPQMGSVHRAFLLLLVAIGAGYAVADEGLPVAKTLAMWTAFLLVSVRVGMADRRELLYVLFSLALAGGIVGAIAIATTGEQELVAGGSIAVGRAQASFDQPNLLGFFLALTVPLALVLSIRRRPAVRLLMTVTVAAAIAGLLLSLSRTSIVGTILALGVLCAWPPFRRLAAVALAIMAVFLLTNLDTLAESNQLQVVGDRLGTLTESGVVQGDARSDLWSTTPAIIADHPLLGVGYGNFSVASPRYGLRDVDGLPFDHPHNVPLTFAVETGLVGGAAFLALLFTVVGTARRALRVREAETWPLALGIVAALVATCVTSMGDYPVRSNAIMAPIMVELGALVACARLAAAARPRPRSATPPAPYGRP